MKREFDKVIRGNSFTFDKSYFVVNVLCEFVVDQILLVNPILNTLRHILGVHFEEHFFKILISHAFFIIKLRKF